MKKISLLFTALVLVLCPIIVSAKTIVVDNDFSDWADVVSLAAGTENITGTNYWLDTSNNTWTTTEPAYDTLVVNQEKMLDILDFKMTNDETNMCFLMQSVYPLMMGKDEATSIYYPFGYPLTFDVDGRPLTFMPGAPADFNHSMVLSFDTDNDDVFEYFGAMNFSWVAESSGQNAMTVVRTIYQDDGDGIYTPTTDTVLSTATNPEGAVSADAALDAGQGLTDNRIEICQPMGDEGLSFLDIGQDVKVRLETHSDIGDYTETVDYTVEGDVINQDALIVGTGKAGSKFGTGVITAYDATTGDALLTINAYDQKIGAKVAVGDIYEDETPEIVTIPLKQRKKPELKFFTATGELGNSQKVYSKSVKNARQWDIDVADVDNNGENEIILASAFRNKITFLIYNLSEEKGKLVKLVDVTRDIDGYTKGAWVAVSNVDTADNKLEIITGPRIGNARFDIWNYTDDTVEYAANASFGTNSEYTKGMNVAALGKNIYAYMFISGGMISDYAYNTTDLVTPGSLAITNVGRIGEMCTAGDSVVVSARNKKKIYFYDQDGTKTDTLVVSSKGAPVDYFKL